MKNHENLPALNKYTSETQYEALKVIAETKSIIKIVQNGSSSRTLGALIRCMWIKQKDYTDDNGVLREGWFVTDAGLHAMSVYKVKYDQEQEEERRRKEYRDNFQAAVVEFYTEYDKVRPQIALLEEELKQAKDSLAMTLTQARNKGLVFSQYQRDAISQRVAEKFGFSKGVSV